MSKTSNCLKMLVLLNTGRVFKIAELADILETNARNIIEYKKELEEAGYFVKSIPGKYGGYYLDKSEIFPVLKFTEDEKEIINLGCNYILSRNDFIKKQEYLNAMAKVFSLINFKKFENDICIINRYPLAMSEYDLLLRYEFIETSIKNNQTIKLNYVSLKNIEREYLFDPYELFMYNNAWFVIGWSLTHGDIRYFKLNRIVKYEKTNKNFRIWKMYNRSKYLDKFGFKNNGEWFHIEFQATGPYAALIKERIYGKNQEVSSIDDLTTSIKVDMQNKESIITFVLGFGKNIKIIEPQWLKDELFVLGVYLQNLYKRE